MHLLAKLPIKLCPNSTYIGGNDTIIGNVNSGQFYDFLLCTQPTRLGLVQVTPLLLIDTKHNKEYLIEKVVDVFVTDNEHGHSDENTFSNRNRYNPFVRYDRGYKRNMQGSRHSSIHLSAI